MVETSGRPGQKAGKGFYEYGPNGKRTRLWPGLFDYGKGKWKTDADVDELKRALLTIQALEQPAALRKA
jgi:3-hydroxyacyl-CoA dehydrogenase/enoyl-CoA hydratase/3-hydroxybutyryl-CoA epimerase